MVTVCLTSTLATRITSQDVSLRACCEFGGLLDAITSIVLS